MKAVISICSILLFTVVACAQESPSDPAMTRIIALENAWNQAQLHHDAEAVAALVHPSFVYTDYDGTQMNKTQFLEDTRDRAYQASLVANQGVRVYLYDDVAVVAGTYHTKGTYKTKPFEHWGRFTDTWLKRDGQWSCVASHTNLIKK